QILFFNILLFLVVGLMCAEIEGSARFEVHGSHLSHLPCVAVLVSCFSRWRRNNTRTLFDPRKLRVIC
ncbi:hypothetical protein, partial [Salmonella sp. M265]|uniref:hypothetical protein n=1 Tax=Salmonella sp. M265 TaxID=3240301 RepID=UPI00352A7A0F